MNKLDEEPSQFSMENVVATAINVIKTESMKPSTIKVYTRQIHKLFTELKEREEDFLFYKECPKCLLFDPKRIYNWLGDKPWGVKLSDRTLKNYLSVILSLVRNYKQDSKEIEDTYTTYYTNFNTLKNSLNAEQEKQEPKEKEIQLKDISMKKLRTGMGFWEKKCKGQDNIDAYSAFMYAMGHIHLDEVLRNELADIVLTEDYIPAIEQPNQNFIWVKGRNTKLLVIRSNKVRNPSRGDMPKEVWIKGKTNTAINKYVQILHRQDIFLDTPIPFCYSSKSKCCNKMSSSLFSQNFRKLWEHIDLPISTTDLRKVYAMDVRKEFGGNLLKEKEACRKLDHNKDTHDKHYILEFK